NVAACEAHDILGKLDHLKIQRWLDGLSLVELVNFQDVSALRFVMSSIMLNRETCSLSYEILKLRKVVFKLKAIMLATEASLKVEIESLREKLKFVIEADLQKKAMLVGRDKAFKEVAAIDEFYRVEFPYLDLLAYHARKSLGFLKSLKPPPFLPHMPSTAGSSSSPFIRCSTFYVPLSDKVKERSRKGQNRIKTEQKREAWRSREMLK
nr:hypothetical protein [Tanacetum cinerariifolium]